MIPVVDTSSFIDLFKWYNPNVFPGLWREFHALVDSQGMTSVIQVLEELRRGSSTDEARKWAAKNKGMFPPPTALEMTFFARVNRVPQFRDAVPEDITGTDVKADLFLIARANAVGGMVITQERSSTRGYKIPDICNHFGVLCGTLDDMMVALGWRF